MTKKCGKKEKRHCVGGQRHPLSLASTARLDNSLSLLLRRIYSSFCAEQARKREMPKRSSPFFFSLLAHFPLALHRQRLLSCLPRFPRERKGRKKGRPQNGPNDNSHRDPFLPPSSSRGKSQKRKGVGRGKRNLSARCLAHISDTEKSPGLGFFPCNKEERDNSGKKKIGSLFTRVVAQPKYVGGKQTLSFLALPLLLHSFHHHHPNHSTFQHTGQYAFPLLSNHPFYRRWHLVRSSLLSWHTAL